MGVSVTSRTSAVDEILLLDLFAAKKGKEQESESAKTIAQTCKMCIVIECVKDAPQVAVEDICTNLRIVATTKS